MRHMTAAILPKGYNLSRDDLYSNDMTASMLVFHIQERTPSAAIGERPRQTVPKIPTL